MEKPKKTERKHKRGQLSVEMMQILAVTLIVLIAFIIISNRQGVDLNRAKAEYDAKSAIDDITGAAKEVYAQGIGAKKKVYVTIPSGVDPSGTYVANNTIVLHAMEDDYVGMEAFDMHGTLPTSQGGHWVWVVSEGNKVKIGYAMISLSKQTLLVTMAPNSTVEKDFDIENIWGKEIKVELEESSSESASGTSLDRTYDYIEANESKTFTARFSTTDKAVGLYLSEIYITASEGTNSEHVKLPVIMQVVTDVEDRPPLTVIPPILNASLNTSNTLTRSFQVCTNEQTSLTSVEFDPSLGSPGKWVGNLGSLGPMAADSCSEKVLTLTVPINATKTNYTGHVHVTGAGAADAEDSIALDIDVEGNGDYEGPIVRNITTGKRRVHEFKPTLILAVGDDTDRGNSSIKECLISADNQSTWLDMNASDGIYDEMVEDILYEFEDGFSMGRHTVYLKCTDSEENVGPVSEYNFTIGKDVLFVIAKGNQSEWTHWVDVKYGKLAYDVADFEEITTDAVDMYYYDAVVFLDWSQDFEFISRVLEYKELGGSVGLFGDSAHLAVQDLDVAWHPDNPHPEHEIIIQNRTHYVTEIFDLGNLTISNNIAKLYSVWRANTTVLGSSGWFYPSDERVPLAEYNRTVFWGAEDPWALNENGMNISKRAIDYMINQSKVA